MGDVPAHFRIYKDESNEWRWTLYAKNSKKIADGGEGYKKRTDCIHGIQLAIELANDTGIWDAEAGKWVNDP